MAASSVFASGSCPGSLASSSSSCFFNSSSSLLLLRDKVSLRNCSHCTNVKYYRNLSVRASSFADSDVGLLVLRRFLNPNSNRTKAGGGKASKLAKRFSFLNITGFRDFPLGDLPMLQVLRYTSENVFVPLTVGGGIRDFTDSNGRHYSSLEVASEYFRSGADKISIGSDAVYAAEEYLRTGVKTQKSSLEQISRVYGNQAVVVSIDPRRVYVKNPNDVQFKTIKLSSLGPNGEEYAWYQCTVNGGREGRPIGAYELAKAVEELGAGEILLNCIDCDGQGKGFDTDLVKLISDAVSIPVIASSGAGAVDHFSRVFAKTNASAALAAGIFHRKEVPIQSVKEHLLKENIEVRI